MVLVSKPSGFGSPRKFLLCAILPGKSNLSLRSYKMNFKGFPEDFTLVLKYSLSIIF